MSISVVIVTDTEEDICEYSSNVVDEVQGSTKEGAMCANFEIE